MTALTIPNVGGLRRLEQPEAAAQAAGLRYVRDGGPGFRRKKMRSGFAYVDTHGKSTHDPAVLRRIKSLAIPPAWTQVWICPLPNGHLQATGRDARGRKQYRYHPDWREVRDETKYARMLAFGKTLPAIRKNVRRDLRARGLSRRKVLATVVRLLEVSLIRVGNDEYEKENHSFGLTTLKTKHVRVKGAELHFEFRGKSGKWHKVDVHDRRLARVVRKCQELPGQELFQYLDEESRPQDIHSQDVNDYLREISGQDFTAKDFRTWSGTLLAAMALQEFKTFDSQAEAKRNMLQAIESVAKRLGNTPAICRKCYIHPEVINSYLDGTLAENLKQRAGGRLKGSLSKLSPQEAAVLALLRKRLAVARADPVEMMRKTLAQRRKARPTRRSRPARA